MNYLDVYTIVLIIIGIIYFFFLVFALLKKENHLAIIFSVQCLLSVIYIFGVTGQLNAKTLEQILFFQKIKYFGSAFIPLSWFLFSYRLYKRKLPNVYVFFGLLIIPVLTLILVTTNEYHHLYYIEVSTINYKGYLITRREVGSLYPIGIIYSFVVTVFSLYVFIKLWILEGIRILSAYLGLFIGLLSALIIGIIYIFGQTPMGIDLLPISFLITAIAFAFSIFYFNLFDNDDIYCNAVFSSLKEGIIVTDYNHMLINYNQSAAEVFSWLKPKNIGKKINRLDEQNTFINNQEEDYIFSLESKGKLIHYDFNVTKLKRNNKIVGYTYMFIDSTEKYNTMKRLKYLARHDGHTGIYNKNTILEAASELFERAKKQNTTISFIILDVDNFKHINDQYGHLAGDYVLKEIASKLNVISKYNGVFGRFGGDEFLIALFDLQEIEVLNLVTKIRDSICSSDCNMNDKIIEVTISIGISEYDFLRGTKDITMEQLINKADEALYISKRKGRNLIEICNY